MKNMNKFFSDNADPKLVRKFLKFLLENGIYLESINRIDFNKFKNKASSPITILRTVEYDLCRSKYGKFFPLDVDKWYNIRRKWSDIEYKYELENYAPKTCELRYDGLSNIISFSNSGEQGTTIKINVNDMIRDIGLWHLSRNTPF